VLSIEFYKILRRKLKATNMGKKNKNKTVIVIGACGIKVSFP
jgi:hypothetical protein